MLYEEESYAVRGAIYEVYAQLGVGFAEPVYQEALECEMSMRGIPFEAQKPVRILYKGRELSQTYRLDLLCYGKIVVELKSVRAILPEHEAQLLNYLRATGCHLGLLVNFSRYPMVDIRSFGNGRPAPEAPGG